MLVSEIWLREWVSPKLTTDELADRLTMAGLEVGSIEPAGDLSDKLVVGRIEEVAAHPDADRLRVCKVNVGRARNLTIVCGAANARQGLYTIAALVGAKLPAGMTISQAAVRGVTSSGMLCSATELGLEESSAGILELTGKPAVGTSASSFFQLDDKILDLELTPNRGDCLSMRGVAREVAALTNSRLKKAVKAVEMAVLARGKLPIKLTASDACPHYVGRIIRGLDVSAATPMWIKERLRRAGIRSLGPCVDVTNYVMLELGQPMHAFDLAKLNGQIEVRYANGREKLGLLDGSTIKPEKTDLLIADKSGPLALAGVMGGAASAVSDQTQDIFLESAFFTPEVIAVTTRDRGIHTDSSHRFERGVDFELQREALERASVLLTEIAGGECGPVIEKSISSKMPRKEPITLRNKRLNAVLGTKISTKKMVSSLRRLAMQIKGKADTVKVIAPSYRFDINIEADLIEEVARVTGFENIPETAPVAHLQISAEEEKTLPLRRLQSCLIDRDYQEVITYSFIDHAMHALFAPASRAVVLENPIASDMSVMRGSLWPGLIKTMQYNVNRQISDLKLFETGRTFIPKGKALLQHRYIAGLLTGSANSRSWADKSRDVDFFDLKGDVEALIALTGRQADFVFSPVTHPVLQPGQSAQIKEGKKVVGLLGRLHPAIESSLGLDQAVYLYEFRLDSLLYSRIPVFHEFSRFPAVQRDIALVIDVKISSSDVIQSIKCHAGDLLVKLELFDQYQGEHIDFGKKSLAFTLTLQQSSRTLTDSETENLMKGVIRGVQADLDAQLR
ncbi:MAG: phenylalanine--tRNA ligase subunit beta [Pseudomonadota bacterium]|nr:phenylalanine--tRNA ligase subunit beta [Pseudomonadota bacterium]